jgi:hypothetical protein
MKLTIVKIFQVVIASMKRFFCDGFSQVRSAQSAQVFFIEGPNGEQE